MSGVITTIPHVLGAPVALINAAGIGSLYDVGIDGRGFLLDTLDQESPFEYRSYEIQAIPAIKPRVDDAEEPGEQTLFPWWTRAQHSWHGGAGQDVFDSPFSSRFAFKQSKGVNIWEDGKVSLLKDTSVLLAAANPDVHLLAGDTALFYTNDGNLIKNTDPGTATPTTVATHAGTPINSITTDGETLFAAYSGVTIGIRGINMGTFAATTLVNSHTDVDLIAFVKGRLIGAKGPSVYDYDLSVTTVPPAHHTQDVAGWVYTGITEIGPGILFSGYAGSRSEIYIARLTAQDIASGLTLGTLRSVWTAPLGEIIHSIRGYLGTSVLIGTSRGLRIGIVSTGEGDIEVSPLVVETSEAIKAIEPFGDYAWFGWSRFDSVSSGLGRVNLGELSYASDLMHTVQETVTDIAHFQNRTFFVTTTGVDCDIVAEHKTTLVASGHFDTGEIRFGTTERKELRFFDFLADGSGTCDLALSVDGGAFVNYVTDSGLGYSERVITVAGTRFEVRMTLKRFAGDITMGPIVEEWRLRSEPKVSGRFRYILPIMLYDRMTAQNGVSIGHNGYAWENLNFLMDIYREDRSFSFQDPASGIPGAVNTAKEVKLEDFRFKLYAPPNGCSGFGGIGLLVMRELR